MIEVVVTEIAIDQNCKPLRRIHLDVDGGKDFCYRGRVSFDAFFSGKHKRNWRKDPRRLYHQKQKEEHEMSERIFANSLRKCGAAKPEAVPEFKVASVWAFYELIGYDYKRKRFIT